LTVVRLHLIEYGSLIVTNLAVRTPNTALADQDTIDNVSCRLCGAGARERLSGVEPR
jgi:hypothetical protein